MAVLRVAGAVALGASSSARADSGVDLFSADTFLLTGDVRAVAVDGERSWVDGAFGKLRFGGREDGASSNGWLRASLGSADIVWQPKLGWALSATIVGTVQQRDRVEAGLSEAYLGFKPLTNGPIKFSARAGLMWPPVSLEHGGPEWGLRDTITPSAINSWIGEEVKFVGAEATASVAVGGGKLGLTAALVDVNDTAGALLAFRGWALHDLKALAWRKVSLPPLASGIEQYQPSFTHPLKEMDGGFLKRPGWYARAAWQLRAPIKVEVIHYDNGGDPEAVDQYLEWGWRTRFDNVGVTATLGPATELRAQAMRGHTVMGFVEEGGRLVDMRFRSAFALITRRFGDKASLSARGEAFATRNHGSEVTSADDEDGWAVTAAGKRSLRPDLSALIEYIHIDSRRAGRERVGLAARQVQNQLQGSLRIRW